jgi:hypothetical protein
MKKPLLASMLTACLITTGLVTLQACSSYGDTSPDTGDTQPTGKTKGQKFSECLDVKSPEECDQVINRRSTSY